MLATRYGLAAIDMVHRQDYGCMAALRGNKLISIPLSEALSKNRTVDQDMIDVAAGILDRTPEQKQQAAS
jgi:6-phosphofructokinase 1